MVQMNPAAIHRQHQRKRERERARKTPKNKCFESCLPLLLPFGCSAFLHLRPCFRGACLCLCLCAPALLRLRLCTLSIETKIKLTPTVCPSVPVILLALPLLLRLRLTGHRFFVFCSCFYGVCVYV